MVERVSERCWMSSKSGRSRALSRPDPSRHRRAGLALLWAPQARQQSSERYGHSRRGEPCPAKGVAPPRCPSVVRQPPPGDRDTLQLALTREPVKPIEVALPDTEALAQPEPGSPGQ